MRSTHTLYKNVAMKYQGAGVQSSNRRRTKSPVHQDSKVQTRPVEEVMVTSKLLTTF